MDPLDILATQNSIDFHHTRDEMIVAPIRRTPAAFRVHSAVDDERVTIEPMDQALAMIVRSIPGAWPGGFEETFDGVVEVYVGDENKALITSPPAVVDGMHEGMDATRSAVETALQGRERVAPGDGESDIDVPDLGVAADETSRYGKEGNWAGDEKQGGKVE